VAIGAAAVLVTAATLPFLLPYAELRRIDFLPRSLGETRRYSADVYSYLTADVHSLVWGGVLRAWPTPEGSLFPGAAIAILAILAVAASVRAARHEAADTVPAPPPARRWAIRTGAILAAAAAAVTAALLLGWSLRTPLVRVTRFDRALVILGGAAAALLALSPRARTAARLWLATPAAIFTLLAFFAVTMSFGPQLRTAGSVLLDTNLYSLPFFWLPGFDGLRVPARFAMVAALALAALAALGAQLAGRRAGRWPLVAAGVSIVIEAAALPMAVNGNPIDYRQAGLAPLPPRVEVGSAQPRVYAHLASLADNAPVLELPLGEPAFDIRYMFYSIGHWHPLVNGYSGGAPVAYGLLAEALKDRRANPGGAWQALRQSGARYVVVHEDGYSGGGGRQTTAWLRANGAREVAQFDGDRLFELDR
jgi:hypothetical protein